MQTEVLLAWPAVGAVHEQGRSRSVRLDGSCRARSISAVSPTAKLFLMRRADREMSRPWVALSLENETGRHVRVTGKVGKVTVEGGGCHGGRRGETGQSRAARNKS